MDVWLDIGADDDTKLWVNDELVWFSAIDSPGTTSGTNMHNERANYAMVEGRVRVSLRAGRKPLAAQAIQRAVGHLLWVVLAP